MPMWSRLGLGVQIARIGAILWPVSGLAIQGAFLAVLGVGGYRVAAGTLSVADLITFILFLFMMLMPLAVLLAPSLRCAAHWAPWPGSKKSWTCPAKTTPRIPAAAFRHSSRAMPLTRPW
ncbi:hypothetical protein [Ornithinimicrobium sp. INDO-MA30-4]|uniref:hypothetical protein n=1 Tax=Ornithinimicrobium sp. INDO-MA30-4 TaxID=2908651 RepID=UPI001F197A7F|nr:hypothetical protein [Ornithinimicrobium sp. INDO-MA30-4]UJH70369.1 hypothetical protein L0A91_14735 [Ornithinimicrobium sp. INDO-MA30-4]